LPLRVLPHHHYAEIENDIARRADVRGLADRESGQGGESEMRLALKLWMGVVALVIAFCFASCVLFAVVGMWGDAAHFLGLTAVNVLNFAVAFAFYRNWL
jgi:hypothetical protein